MWESYNVMRDNQGPDCPSNPNIKAADIKVGTANQPSNTPFDRYSGTYPAMLDARQTVYHILDSGSSACRCGQARQVPLCPRRECARF